MSTYQQELDWARKQLSSGGYCIDPRMANVVGYQARLLDAAREGFAFYSGFIEYGSVAKELLKLLNPNQLVSEEK